jgi:chemotaxis protein methyltransferase CheR
MSLEILKERLELWTGIALERGRRLDLFESLVQERMRAVGLTSVAEYTQRFAQPKDPEVERLINAVTVTYTWFYRDAEQMRAVGELLRTHRGGAGTFRVWIAACATGEEAYTVAMLAARAGRPVELLATDINSEALQHAERGQYGRWAVRELPERLREAFLVPEKGGYRIGEGLRGLLRFKRHNLKDPCPRPSDGGGWDLVVCRNVLIYFPETVARAAVRCMGEALDAQGALLLGSGEVVVESPTGFQMVPFGSGSVLRRCSTAPSLPRAPVKVPPPLVKPTMAAPVRRPLPAPVPARSHLSEGSQHLRAGKLQEAMSALTRALEENPLDARAQMLLGIALHRAQDGQAAIQALRGALVVDPLLWPAVFYLALCYSDLGHAENARSTYAWVQELLKRTPPNTNEQDEFFQDLEAWRGEVRMLSEIRARTGPKGASKASP